MSEGRWCANRIALFCTAFQADKSRGTSVAEDLTHWNWLPLSAQTMAQMGRIGVHGSVVDNLRDRRTLTFSLAARFMIHG
jgi:hypothetical protein